MHFVQFHTNTKAKCTIFKHVNNTHGRFQVEAFDAFEAGCVEKIRWQNSVSLWDVSFFSGNVFTKHFPTLLGLVAS